MEDKDLIGPQAKLITRSKAKTSVDHRKIVNFLEKVSKDETGAPVTWKFTKKGVKYAKGISKKIVKKDSQEKQIKRLKSKPVKIAETSTSKTQEKISASASKFTMKKKPGRKKKVINEDSPMTEQSMQTDNLIISIRRLDPDTSTPGATERIVTLQSSLETSVKEPSSFKACETLQGLTPEPPKKRPGRPKNIHKVIDEKLKCSVKKEPMSVASSKDDFDSNTKLEEEALRSLEKVVAIKRGKPVKQKESLQKKSVIDSVRIGDGGESNSRENSVGRIDSDIESVDSNISGSSTKHRSKTVKLFHRQGIKLGPKKLLRSQDNLMTRRKKIALSSLSFAKVHRKRTLSSDFELLDEISLKKKIRKEEQDEGSPESSVVRDEEMRDKSDKQNENIQEKNQDESLKMNKKLMEEGYNPRLGKSNKKIDLPSKAEPETMNMQTPDNLMIRKRKPGRPPKRKTNNRDIPLIKAIPKTQKMMVSEHLEKLHYKSSKQSLKQSIPKLLKMKKEIKQPETPIMSEVSLQQESTDKQTAGASEISNNSRSVFTFGSLKIIGPGGVKLKPRSSGKESMTNSSDKEKRKGDKNIPINEVDSVLKFHDEESLKVTFSNKISKIEQNEKSSKIEMTQKVFKNELQNSICNENYNGNKGETDCIQSKTALQKNINENPCSSHDSSSLSVNDTDIQPTEKASLLCNIEQATMSSEIIHPVLKESKDTEVNKMSELTNSVSPNGFLVNESISGENQIEKKLHVVGGERDPSFSDPEINHNKDTLSKVVEDVQDGRKSSQTNLKPQDNKFSSSSHIVENNEQALDIIKKSDELQTNGNLSYHCHVSDMLIQQTNSNKKSRTEIEFQETEKNDVVEFTEKKTSFVDEEKESENCENTNSSNEKTEDVANSVVLSKECDLQKEPLMENISSVEKEFALSLGSKFLLKEDIEKKSTKSKSSENENLSDMSKRENENENLDFTKYSMKTHGKGNLNSPSSLIDDNKELSLVNNSAVALKESESDSACSSRNESSQEKNSLDMFNIVNQEPVCAHSIDPDVSAKLLEGSKTRSDVTSENNKIKDGADVTSSDVISRTAHQESNVTKKCETFPCTEDSDTSQFVSLTDISLTDLACSSIETPFEQNESLSLILTTEAKVSNTAEQTPIHEMNKDRLHENTIMNEGNDNFIKDNNIPKVEDTQVSKLNENPDCPIENEYHQGKISNFMEKSDENVEKFHVDEQRMPTKNIQSNNSDMNNSTFEPESVCMSEKIESVNEHNLVNFTEADCLPENGDLSKDNNEKKFNEIESETPGYYFRNIESEACETHNEEDSEYIKSSDHEKSQQDFLRMDGQVKPTEFENAKENDMEEKNIDKDENSSSSELGLNQSYEHLPTEDEKNLSVESSMDQGDANLKKKMGGKNISPTQRVFQLRQKTSRSPLENIRMRQSKEEKEYYLEQSQRAYRREEKQRKMKINRQKLETGVTQDHAEIKNDAVEKINPIHSADPEEAIQSESQSLIIEDASVSVEDQCKPCKVILIDFMKYINVAEKSDNEEEHEDGNVLEHDNDMHATPTDNQKLDTERSTKNGDATKTMESEPYETGSHSELEGKKKRRPSARKQATSYHFNRNLTAEIVHYPDEETAYKSDSVVPPLRLKIKQKVAEPKKRVKASRPLKRKARKSMSPKKKVFNPDTINMTDINQKDIDKKTNAQVTTETEHKNDIEKTQTVEMMDENRENNESDTDLYECIYNGCGFQSSIKFIESHINLVHLRGDLSEESEQSSQIDVKQFYKSVNTSVGHSTMSTPPRQILQAEVQQVEQSPEAVIIKVVLPSNVHQGKGCYCCSYCDYSSSQQQDILNHINENHRPDILYTCSLCDKQFKGNKDGIGAHFAKEHPNEPILYKSMPDFYDNRKSVQQTNTSISSSDKGNIFEKFSDMFPNESSAKERPRKVWHEKTSAEADSTTAEHDEHEGNKESENVLDRTKLAQDQLEEFQEDGIEALGRSYAEKHSIDGTTSTDKPNINPKDTQQSGLPHGPDEHNDMGLKIVDVVSLRDLQCSEWPDTATQQQMPEQSSKESVHSRHISNITQNICESNINIVTALTAPRRYPQKFTENTQPLIPQTTLHQKNIQNTQPQTSRKIPDGKTCTTYKCEKCNVHAPVLATMVEHLRLSHKDIEKLFLCPYCRQYEGATEPDIHRHIKQYHQQNNQQKSPPVALSSAAKQHLRTIQVTVGEGKFSGEKIVMEKDIYKCLKCNGHMPSLDYIYAHLEKQHNEFFVNVCPECKRFKSKDEQVVFNHIRNEHGKSKDNVTLSVAIEENLYTRVHCLTKGKIVPQKSQTSTPLLTQAIHTPRTLPSGAFIGSRLPSPQQLAHQQNVRQPLNFRPNIPSASQIQPNFPSSVPLATGQSLPAAPVPSKSSLRKSRPMHRDAPRGIPSSRFDSDSPRSSPINKDNSVHDPPPLMRAPPPLIRFQQTQFGETLSQLNSIQGNSNLSDTPVRGTSFAMTDRLQRLNSPSTSRINSPVASQSNEHFSSPTGRPVLKIPNVRSYSSVPSTMPPPYSAAIETNKNLVTGQKQFSNASEPPRTTLGSALDLTSQLGHISNVNRECEDMPPDAFKIFNIRPGAPQTDPNINKYNQFQVRPARMPSARIPHGIHSSPSVGHQMQHIHGLGQQHLFTQTNRLRAPNHGDQNPSREKLFKCPHCPHIVPLTMNEVHHHIETVHPGSPVVFHPLD